MCFNIMFLLKIVFVFAGDDFLTWINTKNKDDYYKICMLIIIGSLIAFSLEVSEYYVVYKTSSLTLTVVGIIKVSNLTTKVILLI